MRKLIILLLSCIIFLTSFSSVQAQSTPPINQELYFKAIVTNIKNQTVRQFSGYQTLSQTIEVRILDGKNAGKIITIQQNNDYRISSFQKISVGEKVVLDAITQQNNQTKYTITDTYRITPLIFIALAFFLLTIFLTGKRGFGALLGLAVSLLVIFGFIIPQIIHHNNPLLICFIGAVIILLTTTYLAHGFSKETSLAVVSSFFSLVVAILFAFFSVQAAHLVGLGTEDSYLLEITPNIIIDPRGLFLGGILIGTLGALNDITTTQTASVTALHTQNPKLNFLDLAEHAFGIGQQHILSLINTLVLAYAGSSLPIFIFFLLNPSHIPVWVIINNESVGDEIIRTIAGSIGLLLAIPITTFLASWWATKNNK